MGSGRTGRRRRFGRGCPSGPRRETFPPEYGFVTSSRLSGTSEREGSGTTCGEGSAGWAAAGEGEGHSEGKQGKRGGTARRARVLPGEPAGGVVLRDEALHHLLLQLRVQAPAERDDEGVPFSLGQLVPGDRAGNV